MKNEKLLAAQKRRQRKRVELTWEEKGQLVREVLGDNAFDPWRRLDEKAARGLDITVEARYLEQAGIVRQPLPAGMVWDGQRYIREVSASKEKSRDGKTV